MATTKNARVCDQKYQISGDDAKSLEYNPASGAQKSLPIGPRLLPIPTGMGTWTTTPNGAATPLPNLGLNIAVYNNSGTVGSIVIGGKTIVTLAPGVIDSSGNVGVPCPPNAWTYLSMSYNQYVITSAATLLVFIIEDPTWLNQQTGPLVPQNVPGFVPPVNS